MEKTDAKVIDVTWAFCGESSCWKIKAKCPLCSKISTHGGGNGPAPDFGYRLSHCCSKHYGSYPPFRRSVCDSLALASSSQTGFLTGYLCLACRSNQKTHRTTLCPHKSQLKLNRKRFLTLGAEANTQTQGQCL